MLRQDQAAAVNYVVRPKDQRASRQEQSIYEHSILSKKFVYNRGTHLSVCKSSVHTCLYRCKDLTKPLQHCRFRGLDGAIHANFFAHFLLETWRAQGRLLLFLVQSCGHARCSTYASHHRCRTSSHALSRIQLASPKPRSLLQPAFKSCLQLVYATAALLSPA